MKADVLQIVLGCIILGFGCAWLAFIERYLIFTAKITHRWRAGSGEEPYAVARWGGACVLFFIGAFAVIAALVRMLA
ncbi:hypothetical protein [Actinomadura parmotrematis]|uniref:Immunity protein 17 n=1 Tax=Actinomadura parmotrematis TaxID=2864039 RepID=A0ABS7FK90_9ACTN|nr:hypothetical protein [Actinomadura parmotrematis]MBW8480787.1 hypothetical protein [Actinomadura parmotrematis]